MFRTFFSIFQFILSFFISNLQQFSERIKVIRQSSAETNCAIIVASATPSTPILKTSTNNKSRAVFVSVETARNIKGLLESPTARIMPEPIL